MGGAISNLFGAGDISGEQKRQKKLMDAQAAELRREENKAARNRAGRTRVLSSQQRGASLFPSDFAPTGSNQLGVG